MLLLFTSFSILATSTNAFVQTRNSLKTTTNKIHRPYFGINRLLVTNDESETSTTSTPPKTIELQRTIYKINPAVSSSVDPSSPGASYQIEERTFFESSSSSPDTTVRKRTYVLRGTPSDAPLGSAPEPAPDGRRRRVTRVGPELFTMELGEMMTSDEDFDEGMGPGTGGNAWEAAIAMSLFFAARPDVLKGKCVELGSGVGLGGILSTIVAGIAERNGKFTDTLPPSGLESLTMTDSNLQVLTKCIENAKAVGITPPFAHVTELDWYDRNAIPASELHAYQTIIASDCAYLYPDVKPLAYTMAHLMATVEEGGRAHHFGPFQRDAIRDLQSELENRYRIDVDLGLVEMNTFVMDPVLLEGTEEIEDEIMGEGVIVKDFVKKATQEYLYIDAQHNEAFVGDGESFFRGENDNDDRYDPELQVEYER